MQRHTKPAWVPIALALSAVLIRPAAALDRAAEAPRTPISWYNGVFVSTDNIFNCISAQIEVRMQGYVGYGLRPGGRTPAVGEVWYAHLVLAHTGNVCAGGSATHLEFFPPPNTALAVSGNSPIFCFWRRHDFWSGSQSVGTVLNMGANCPQNPGTGPWGGYNLDPVSGSSRPPWTVPNYSWMEFLVPLRSTQVVNGNAAQALLNPNLGVFSYPNVPVFVNADVLFRDGFDGMQLPLEICTLPNTSGC